jgi:hypothetical protein
VDARGSKPLLEILVVAGGYVAAGLLASAAVAIRVANTNTADAQAASGMYAFGDSFLFLAVFAVLSLVPTGAGLWFLRPHRRFWIVASTIGLGVAATGLAAAVLFGMGRHAATSSPLGLWAAFSVLRILVAPLLALGFLVCGVLSPFRFARAACLAAAVTEAAVGAYGGFTWFVPLFFARPWMHPH